jgi:homopolymeric O-antigen transport system ATP-binding protein
MRYDTLRESMVTAVRASFKRLRGNNHSPIERLWALKDISFEVKPGEVMGIIGPNGAGKSTLLQILSRIIEPTTGYAELYGHVGSLLEIGTGFHPDLTGRENVYLNGAVLGMSRKEINSRFDEIVEFAGIERFLETAVKRYSSGMYVRLAFSVAAHFNPEILIIDEVLAVGDADFQKKCFEKMGQVIKSGRTILLVTHSMAAITQLCQNAMLIKDGRLQKMGPASEVVGYYEKTYDAHAEVFQS